jgi:hypothetical protein
MDWTVSIISMTNPLKAEKIKTDLEWNSSARIRLYAEYIPIMMINDRIIDLTSPIPKVWLSSKIFWAIIVETNQIKEYMMKKE